MAALAETAECRGAAAAAGNPTGREYRSVREGVAKAAPEQGLIHHGVDGDQRTPEPVS